MANNYKLLAAVFGVLAGIVGSYHGYSEVLQGNAPTPGIQINAIGPPCQGSSCLPAMTLIPNFLYSGIAAIAVSLVILVWSAGFVGRKRSAVILVALSILQLLVGGGFLPPLLGLIAGGLATRANRGSPVQQSANPTG